VKSEREGPDAHFIPDESVPFVHFQNFDAGDPRVVAGVPGIVNENAPCPFRRGPYDGEGRSPVGGFARLGREGIEDDHLPRAETALLIVGENGRGNTPSAVTSAQATRTNGSE